MSIRILNYQLMVFSYNTFTSVIAPMDVPELVWHKYEGLQKSKREGRTPHTCCGLLKFFILSQFAIFLTLQLPNEEKKTLAFKGCLFAMVSLKVAVTSSLTFHPRLMNMRFSILHCVKSVQIRSFSGSYFPVFGLINTWYFVIIAYKFWKSLSLS